MTDERDIVERLRAVCNCNIATAPCGMEEECHLDFEAADEIIHLRAELAAARDATNSAYSERNKLVALVATLFPAGTKRTAIEGWSEDWHGCVYIDLSFGQVSWHYHDSEAYLFSWLPEYPGEWDGHTTEEKYDRILRVLKRTPNAD